jgi:thymidylate synthase ThyX
MTKHDYNVRMLCDSVAPGGERLATLELTYPRIVHAEFMTHRLMSRNSASSRAIPTPRLLEMVRESPMLPKWWGKNQAGMQASEQLTGNDLEITKRGWADLMEINAGYAERWHERGFHKQLANRVIEPWMFITVIASATEWDNFLSLRDTWPDPDQPPGPAQPEIAWLGREVRRLLTESTPRPVDAGAWHLPLVETEDETDPLYVGVKELDHLRYLGRVRPLDGNYQCSLRVAISAARCARVSYLTHDGRRDLSEDVTLHDRLARSGHWSPFEHVARAMQDTSKDDERMIGVTPYGVRDIVECGLRARRWSGNFRGWVQYRKLFAGEHVGHAPGDAQ